MVVGEGGGVRVREVRGIPKTRTPHSQDVGNYMAILVVHCNPIREFQAETSIVGPQPGSKRQQSGVVQRCEFGQERSLQTADEDSGKGEVDPKSTIQKARSGSYDHDGHRPDRSIRHA